MRTLEEVLDRLDIQLLKHQGFVFLTEEDAAVLAQALTEHLLKGETKDE